jgi:glycosyltransferase involved in cell wall biosynthesis
MKPYSKRSEPPLVSVVVASYNHESFVIDALDSVAGQTYSNLELIVIDDFSKDGTGAKVKAWATNSANKKCFSRLKVELTPRNMGAHNTLNRGASLAKGKFINFLNSDDFFHPERIDLLVDAARNWGGRWGFAGVVVVDESGEKIGSKLLPPEVGFVYDGIEHAKRNYPALSCALLERNFVISTGNIFIETDLFARLNGFRNLRYLHDWDLILRATRISEPLLIDQPLYAYRLHGTNSFKALADVAEVEGTFVMQDHLHALMMAHENNLAPSPRNWPVLFDMWVDRLGLSHLLK